MPSSRNSPTASSSERTGNAIALEQQGPICVGRFRAMAGPCEVLLETDDIQDARAIVEAVARCAWRVESKFSRYRPDNIVHTINNASGRPVAVDDETANLLDFAATLFELSGGLFDITSGVLRRAWSFNGTDEVPTQEQVAALLPLVGWHKVTWQRPVLTLLPGMQIDFGGVGKEYAVDQAAQQASALSSNSCLVNFGGDLAISRPRRGGHLWSVGIESVNAPERVAVAQIHLRRGALATSGDTHRYVLRDGRRYSHILDPRTGWPIEHAPRSVTVCAETCTQAGMLSTMALLRGVDAEQFLREAGATHWIQR